MGVAALLDLSSWLGPERGEFDDLPVRLHDVGKECPGTNIRLMRTEVGRLLLVVVQGPRKGVEVLTECVARWMDRDISEAEIQRDPPAVTVHKVWVQCQTEAQAERGLSFQGSYVGYER